MEQNSIDINFGNLMKSIFDKPPTDPFSLRIKFISDIDEAGLAKLLAIYLQYGSETLFGTKELAKLSSEQIETLRQYLQMIGYDVEYSLKSLSKVVTDYNPDGTPFEKTIPVNNWNIMFKLCDSEIR
jgi:hypothetical protein